MRVSVSLDFTLILSWSSEEAGRYLETFKAYEHKSVDLISEKTGNTPYEIVHTLFYLRLIIFLFTLILLVSKCHY